MERNFSKSLNLVDFEKTEKYLEQLRKKLMIMQRELDPN